MFRKGNMRFLCVLEGSPQMDLPQNFFPATSRQVSLIPPPCWPRPAASHIYLGLSGTPGVTVPEFRGALRLSGRTSRAILTER